MKREEKSKPVVSSGSIHDSEGAFWDHRAEENEEIPEKAELLVNPVEHRQILQMAGLESDLTGKKALECGCGTGFISVLLARLGAEVCCFDLSPKSIEIARKRASLNDVSDRVNAKVAAFETLDYENESFDIIVGSNILHHIPDKTLAGNQIKRMLRKGGKATFYEVNANNPILMFFRNHVVGKSRLIPKRGSPHEHPLTMDEVNTLSSIFDNQCIVSYPRFCFFGKLGQQVLRHRFTIISSLLDGIDRIVYILIPPLRKYSYEMLIELTK